MSVQFNYQDREVWVVGAGRGIGRRIAEDFVRAGANVTGFDLHFPGGETFAHRVVNIADAEQVKTVTKELLESQKNLHVLINAAGILALGATDELPEDHWAKCFDVNVTGSFNLFRYTIPQFKKQRSGSIVVVASNSAHAPRIGMSAYGASKTALVSLTRSVGLELAEYGVRCNLVSPGSTETDMLREMLGDNFAAGEKRLIQGLPDQYKLGIPLKKIAQPREVAAAVLFLASDASSHTTLQDIVIDGGATLGA